MVHFFPSHVNEKIIEYPNIGEKIYRIFQQKYCYCVISFSWDSTAALILSGLDYSNLIQYYLSKWFHFLWMADLCWKSPLMGHFVEIATVNFQLDLDLYNTLAM